MVEQIIKTTLLDQKILFLELNNPLKNNALSLKMLNELINILSEENLSSNYRILVFKGLKDTPFSAGADLNEIKVLKKEGNINLYHSKLNKLVNILSKLKLIKISVIKSYCIGAGFILAMNTDVSIANESCLFSIPASKLNIKLSEKQLDFLLQKFPGNPLLKEAIFTGRKFSSSEAYNSNIINKVFKDKDFEKNYLRFLENFIINNRNVFLYYYKKLFN